MKKIGFFLQAIILSALMLVFFSCEEDPQLPDSQAAFESAQLGFMADENELMVNINFSRPAPSAGTITINFEATGLTYGVDFTTTPEATGNTITLPVVAGASQVSFTISKAESVLLDGDESVTFLINGADNGLVVGETTQLVLSFAEILAEQAIMNINGGGPDYPNKVFIDLSANRQTAVERTSWDLGFFMGDDFRVILNSSVTMMARALDKTDLNAVTVADIVGFDEEMVVGANATIEAMAWIDDPEGDLKKTAIAAISETDSENKVYIINRGAANPPSDPSQPVPSRGWKKIRVIRNGNGYTLQHADIAATTYQEIQITKDSQYNFRYIHFENGLVNVEPAKDRWDIAWTGFTNSTNFGGGSIPYYFQDIILQSRNGVETAELLIANAGTYEAFEESNLTGVIWQTTQLGIGAKWRSGGGPGSAPAVRSDRFYLVKDVDGNIYKVRFTALTQNGERGRPQVEFALVKKGE